MSICTNQHGEHTHIHSANCGHIRIQHNGHIDFLHDGHLHNVHLDHIDEHSIEVSDINPDHCTNGHSCTGHDSDHVHGSDCGHPQVPHGDHIDYLVDGHLHHPHASHCDQHGRLSMA